MQQKVGRKRRTLLTVLGFAIASLSGTSASAQIPTAPRSGVSSFPLSSLGASMDPLPSLRLSFAGVARTGCAQPSDLPPVIVHPVAEGTGNTITFPSGSVISFPSGSVVEIPSGATISFPSGNQPVQVDFPAGDFEISFPQGTVVYPPAESGQPPIDLAGSTAGLTVSFPANTTIEFPVGESAPPVQLETESGLSVEIPGIACPQRPALYEFREFVN